MTYIFECSFANKPECNECMLAFSKLSANGETKEHCAALGIRPRCPEEGCRGDCPLKKIG